MRTCFYLLLFLSFSSRQGARDDTLCLREQGEHTTSARSRRCNARLAPRSPQQPEVTLSVAPASWVGQLLWYQEKVTLVSQATLVSPAATAGICMCLSRTRRQATGDRRQAADGMQVMYHGGRRSGAWQRG